MQEAHHTL